LKAWRLACAALLALVLVFASGCTKSRMLVWRAKQLRSTGATEAVVGTWGPSVLSTHPVDVSSLVFYADGGSLVRVSRRNGEGLDYYCRWRATAKDMIRFDFNSHIPEGAGFTGSDLETTDYRIDSTGDRLTLTRISGPPLLVGGEGSRVREYARKE
jgi:hypothetical protein